MVDSTPALAGPSAETRIKLVAYGALTAWVLILAAGILILNDGRFIYTLDDTYIHLAMSEGIHAGGYGINPDEPASAASSILFPYLLAWASPYPFHEYLPFAINVAALVGTVFLFRLFLTEIGLDGSPRRRIAATLIAAALPVVLGLVGLVFMGMEHTLQVMLDTAAILGLIRAVGRHRVDPWLPAVLVLAPLVRYESLLIAGLVLIVLARYGWWRLSVLTGLLIAGAVGVFTLYLLSLGLPPIPNSISAHSHSVNGAVGGHQALSVLLSVGRHFLWNCIQLRGVILLVFTVAFGAMAFRSGDGARTRDDRTIALFGFLACVGYLLFGKISGMGRHETALFAVVTLVLLYLLRGRIVPDVENGAYSRPTILGLYLAVAVCGSFIPRNVYAPFASNNIYEQQYQMHRLVRDHIDGPVAVNDIGWVSYRNDGYVLDLWGLASTEALKARWAGYSIDMLRQIVDKHHVRLVMIYDSWFGPRGAAIWTPLARLRTSRPAIYAGDETVSIYAPPGSDIDGLREKLAQFAKTLPPGTALEPL